VRQRRPFIVLFVLAVAAGVAAFVLHLALRGRTIELGYELGRARSEQARLRETKRVLELEAASYKTPQRIEVLAHALLGMQPPSPDRIIVLSEAAAVRRVGGGPSTNYPESAPSAEAAPPAR
jgi:cell division protein FtsL